MSLDDLMPAQDTPVMVGVLSRKGEGIEVPVYIVDLGVDQPPVDTFIGRFKKLSLEVQPTADGFMYYVVSDRMVYEITADNLDRALAAASPREMLQELGRSGTPEFSSCIEVSATAHACFTEARKAHGGRWMFIALTQAATQVVLSADDTILMIKPGKREDYPMPE